MEFVMLISWLYCALRSPWSVHAGNESVQLVCCMLYRKGMTGYESVHGGMLHE